MAEPKRTALGRLRSLAYYRAKLRDDADRVLHPTGMTVGMPKCTVDACTLQLILDTLDECEASLALAIEAMRWTRDHTSGCEDWCERAPRGPGCRYCHISEALEVIDDD